MSDLIPRDAAKEAIEKARQQAHCTAQWATCDIILEALDAIPAAEGVDVEQIRWQRLRAWVVQNMGNHFYSPITYSGYNAMLSEMDRLYDADLAASSNNQ